jgi:hypothetical protein
LLTSHAGVQVIVLQVLFKLLASVLVIHAHQFGGIYGYGLLVRVPRRLVKYG